MTTAINVSKAILDFLEKQNKLIEIDELAIGVGASTKAIGGFNLFKIRGGNSTIPFAIKTITRLKLYIQICVIIPFSKKIVPYHKPMFPINHFFRIFLSRDVCLLKK